jgi:hypothetical protein
MSRRRVLITAMLLVGQLLLVAMVGAARNLQIATPLQALTIWDPEVVSPQMDDTNSSSDPQRTLPNNNASFRARFLAKFRAGLQAEAHARQQLTATSRSRQRRRPVDPTSPDWARQAADHDRAERRAQERFVEVAYDQAVAPFQSKPSSSLTSRNPNKYQFVGVIHPSSSSSSSQSSTKQPPPITWYARPKPKRSKWTVRLVHVNRAAILKDLYDQGKIDVFARYETPIQSTVATNDEQDASASPATTPKVASSYLVRERSWK